MTVLEKFREFAARENKAMRLNLGLGASHPCPKVAERRAKVAELKADGMKLNAIAKKLGVSLATIKNDSSRFSP